MLDPGVPTYIPIKGRRNVSIFVGLQGNGKTTTVGKYAHYYKKRGFKPALLCVDTFRAGAYDQLLQTAASAKVSFFGSRIERDPVKIALDGIECLSSDPEGFDMIIVDTSGRHKQESALFKEMEEIVAAVKPDQIIFVMDGSIGQAAMDQAMAFKNAVKVGAVIVTKLDGHAKGGGALAAVAATQSPIIFLGTGEHLDNLEPFDPKSFISKLLGWGDMNGLVDVMTQAIGNDGKTDELAKHLQEGKFSLNDMRVQFKTMLDMGPLDTLMANIPGMSQMMASSSSQGKKADDGTKRIKSFLVIMDSMTNDELDNPKILTPSRILRIARGSGHSLKNVNDLLAQHKMMKGVVGSPGMAALAGGNAKGRGMPKNMIPPEVLKQMGGAGNMSNIMKQLGGMMNIGGMPQ